MSAPEPGAVLHLTSPVHVATDAGVLHVRRMGLAILAFVALEGPTRRERLAEVVWGHRRGPRNLRVELHRLRAAFATVGLTPLQDTVDPLALAPSLGVAPVEDVGGFLVGLEDVSSDYQAWVEHRRDLIERASASSARDGLLAALTGSVRPPFVLVLQGLPGSGRRTLAQALAQRLHLPFVEGLQGDHGAVRYLPPELHGTPGLAARVRHDRRSVWVVGRSAFGADAPSLLELRATVPPERWRFEQLRPLAWREAQRGFLAGVAFREAAALYLAACGHPAYLRELIALRSGAPVATPVPIPQRVQAAIALEEAQLSATSRAALERLAVFGDRLPPERVAAVATDTDLDELERGGWLRYEGGAWRFADPLVAKVLRARVPAGQRARLLRAAAGGPSLDRTEAPAGCLHGAALPATRVVPGPPVFLDAPRRTGDDVTHEAGSLVWSRLAAGNGPTGVAWPLPEERLVVLLKGRAAVADDGTGAPADATVLCLTVRGGDAPCVRLEPALATGPPDARDPSRPTTDVFERWFLLPPGARVLDLACHPACAVVELEVRAHRVSEGADGDGAVEALDLGAPGARPAVGANLTRPRAD